MAKKRKGEDMNGTMKRISVVQEQLHSFKEDIRKEVKETSEDVYRRKRMVVFGMEVYN